MALRTKETVEQRDLQGFARALCKLRRDAELSQESLAEKTGLSTRQIQRLESAQCTPILHTLKKLRRTLGCSWTDLLGK